MLGVSRSGGSGKDMATARPEIESSEHPQVGGIEQLRDGSLIIPIGIISSQTAAGPLTVHSFRSTDGGKNMVGRIPNLSGRRTATP